MKIIVFNGSPRAEKGNTHFMVEAFLKGAQEAGAETENIFLVKQKIKPCTGCYDCTKQGRCTIEGDDFDEILEKIRTAEGLILGSPVYLSSVVPQMMALLGRATFVAYWNNKFLTGKENER